MKTEERQQARDLRRTQGCSIKEIARILNVSTSWVSHWVRDIELTPEQHAALSERNVVYARQQIGHRIWSAQCRERRRAYQDEGRFAARRREGRHVAGCMLFWADGDKHRNAVRLANSDPEILRFFIEFLRHYFQVPDAKIAITCNLFADHVDRQRNIEAMWLDALALPRSSLRRSILNVYSKHSQKERKNKLPYGTCKLAVHETRIVQHIYGAIQEYAGFDRPAWLD